jgi:HD-like signal output (HDOD) protein
VASQDAFAASMLQDVGLLVLASKMSERFGKVLAAARGGERSLEEAETEVLGVTHAEVGAYLLGIWGLPYPVVEAVAFHHQPRRSSATTLDVVSGVHVASALAHELHVGHADGLACGPTLDVEWLRGLGLGDRIPTWRNLAMYEAKTVERQG